MKYKFLIIFRIISVIILVAGTIYIIIWNHNNNSNKQLQSSLVSYVKNTSISIPNENLNTINLKSESSKSTNASTNIDSIEVDFNSLLQKNSETVGWIRISNTNIDFPVVKAQNNSFYINHDFEKKWNPAGWIFSDYRNSFPNLETNTIIFGHNRRNGTMFSSLNNYLEHQPNDSILFATTNSIYTAEIFSLYRVTAKNLDLPINFASQTDFSQTINSWKEKSIYQFNTPIQEDDKILTICTCANNSSYRIILHAKLTKIK